MKPGIVADKRRRATAALTAPDAGTRSDREIAEALGVSQPFISRMRRRLAAAAAVPAAAVPPMPGPTAPARRTTTHTRVRSAIEQLHYDRYSVDVDDVVTSKREPSSESAIRWKPYD